MHIDLDAFFVSVERMERTELVGKPVVVGGSPDRRGVVAASSYEAREYGIHSGMPLKIAVRLCPWAIFVTGNHKKYRHVSHKFMDILAGFSPFLEPMGIDEAYLDVTGFESLHGSTREMAVKIRQAVSSGLGVSASIGIAGSKVAAKVASAMAKPDGLLEVPVGGDAGFLTPLEIGRLPGIGKKTEETLKSLGVKTLGQLAKMPPDSLKVRLGVYGETLIRYAGGMDDRPVEPPEEAKSISRETTFAKDTHDRGKLEAVLKHLSEQVGFSLRRRQRQTQCITIKLRFSDFTTITRSRTLSVATHTDRIIFDTGFKMLWKELDKSRLAVRLIGIGASRLGEKGQQMDMLADTSARQDKLEQVIDRIRLKYGFEAIQTGRTLKLDELFNKNGDMER